MAYCAYNMDGIKNIYIANFEDVVGIGGKENSETISTITLKDGAKFKKLNFQTSNINSETDNNNE